MKNEKTVYVLTFSGNINSVSAFSVADLQVKAAALKSKLSIKSGTKFFIHKGYGSMTCSVVSHKPIKEGVVA